MSLAYYRTQADLAPSIGMIVPTWFPPETDPGQARRVLALSTSDLETVMLPRHCLVVADGPGPAVEAARDLQAGGAAFELVVLGDGPHGKGGAVGRGLAALLERDGLDWFLVRDHDGDHQVCDVPRLIRLGLQMRESAASILVNGARHQPARPMGWEREQYERLVNEVVWRGLHFAAARQGRAVDEAFCRPGVAVPDLQSGFKAYSRAAAELVAGAYACATWPDRRWGCEIVATIAVVSAGGLHGELQRTTLDQQPLTTYEGTASRAEIHGDILLSAAARLGLPGEALLTWFDAAAARSELRCAWSNLPDLAALRRRLCDGLGCQRPATPAPWLC